MPWRNRYLLNEWLAAIASRPEEVQQERDHLIQYLEATRAMEHATLGEILSMLSRAELVEQKANDAEAATEETRQKIIDSQLYSVGLEMTLEDLNAKMAQDQAE